MFSMNVACSLAVAALGLVSAKIAVQEPVLAAPSAGQNQIGWMTRKDAGPLLTAHFQNAHVRDVLDWLQKSGVNFVVADSELKDRTVTMSLTNQPVDDILNALGSALDGHWVREGKIRVFKSGRAPFGTVLLGSDDYDFKSLPKFDDYNFKSLPQFDDKALKPFFDKNGGQLKLDDGNSALGKLFGKGGDTKDGLTRKFDGLDRSFGNFFPKFGDGVKIDASGFRKLIKSLTDRQKQLEKTQGYLKFDDLTPDQKALLNVKGSPEGVELKFEADGESITIKSK